MRISQGGKVMSVETAAGENHLTNWYAEMLPREKSAFWACTGGWILDAMDVQIYSFVIPSIIAAFHLSNSDAGLIGTSTLLASASGGWFAGAVSDRFGRVKTLQVTIAWFAVFTFLTGFAQNYTQLLICRALMGFGFGGEWAAAAVLIGEFIAAKPSAPCRADGPSAGAWRHYWRPYFSASSRKKQLGARCSGLALRQLYSSCSYAD
jgi:hypothetical protein